MRRPASVIREVRRELKRKGSPAYARRLQMFFKSPVQAYGWRTARVRKLAQRLRRELATSGGDKLLFAVAEKLFAAPTLEEQTLGVLLLARAARRFGAAEFRRLERWLPRIRNWAACDALCTVLLGPLLLADPRLTARVHRWARSANFWERRAAAVALVPAARRGKYPKEIFRVSNTLLRDPEYMVQKGVGWLLRESAKVRRPEVVSYLLRVRTRAPRLVLRTACETLPARDRRRVLA